MAPTAPDLGALFAGYGGLDRALEDVFGAKVRWVCEYDEAPSKILAHVYPDAPNFGDVTKIDWSTVVKPELMSGGYPCFPNGTLILTRAGWKAIEAVVAGDEVFTHQNRWRPVVRNWGWHMAPTVTIKGQGHDGLVASDNHKFPTRAKTYHPEAGPSGRYLLDPEVTDVEAKDLAGRFWASPTTFPADTVPPIDGETGMGLDITSPEFLWVVGKYLANGSLAASDAGAHHYMAVRWCDGAGPDAEETATMLTAARIRFGRTSERTTEVFTSSSRPLVMWLEQHFGHGAAEKSVAPWVYGLAEEQRRALFDGYIHGDSHPLANGGVRFNTVSRKLAISMQLLAQTLGYYTSINKVTPASTKVIEGRTVNQRPWWRVACNTDSRSAVNEKGRLWAKVKTVEYTGRTEQVWNLEVAEDHSYTVEGKTAANCQPFSDAGARKGSDDPRHLFPYFAQAIERLRPRVVVAENVRGHLTLGFDIVMAEWVRLGYDVQWMLLRASDVGAPHPRARLFFLATDPGQVPALPASGVPVTELVDGVWSEVEDSFFGRSAWTGKFPRAGRLVGSVVYDNTSVLGNPQAAISRWLGSVTHRVRYDADLNVAPDASVVEAVELVGEVDEAALLPTPRATRGGSGTETMYRLGGVRTDEDRPQGQVLLPTPTASLAMGSTPSVKRTRERLMERGVKLDEAINVLADDAARGYGAGLPVNGRLEARVLLKTPTAQLAVNGGSQHPNKHKEGGHGPTLADEMEHLLPTPRAMDHKASLTAPSARRHVEGGFGSLTEVIGARLLPTPRASDGEKGGPNQRGSSGDMMLPSAVHHMGAPTAVLDRVDLLPALAPATEEFGVVEDEECDDTLVQSPAVDVPVALLPGYEQWGQYGPAIARWEKVIGRVAPPATSEVKPGGAQRLSPVFVEWMMGQPLGRITDPEIGITRNEQLKACGNGVVTLQAAVALRLMLATR